MKRRDIIPAIFGAISVPFIAGQKENFAGNPKVPSENDVRYGIKYDGNKTGNLTLPPPGVVLKGYRYGALGNEFVGTLTIPNPSGMLY